MYTFKRLQVFFDARCTALLLHQYRVITYIRCQGDLDAFDGELQSIFYTEQRYN